ncbi:hypothetical protein P9850_12060 [Anoxybacillus rupiensis]|uniref:Flp pilus assembly protein TadB n=1 Tax=Anoxybacteroides rupiense TaxID=311460 RepID=A0ABD5IYW4_9BACL|nr:hypothetical protein [Anoxybacillus rupiensis]
MKFLLIPILILIFYFIYRELFSKTYLSDYIRGENHKKSKFIVHELTGILMNSQKEKEIQEKLHAAGLEMKPQEFIRMKILYPMVSLTIFILAAFISDNPVIKIGGVLSPLLYFYPDYLLRKRTNRAKIEKRIELPEYLKFMALLLKSHTVAQAIIKAQAFAGPYLKPHAERLALEIESYPGSDRPFKTFAENVDIPEAYTFMIALQQAMKTSKKQSMEILNNQIQMLRALEKENYRYLIQQKPEEINRYGLILLVGMTVYPLVLVVIALSEGFKQI